LTGNKNDDTAQLWDLQTPQERATLAGHLTNVSAVCFSADSKLVLAMGNTTRLLDAETGQVKVAFKGFTGRGNVGAIGPAGNQPTEGNVGAISPDGKSARTGRIWGKLWTVETGEVIKAALKGQPAAIQCGCFSPDSKRLLTGGAGARQWDAQTGRELAKLEGFPGPDVSVCFSPDGKTALTGSARVRLWDAETGRQKLALEAGGLAACFSRDGKIIFAAADRSARLWDAETGQD